MKLEIIENLQKKKARKKIKEIKRIKIEIEKNKKMIYLD
jgi:hypothetical protein